MKQPQPTLPDKLHAAMRLKGYSTVTAFAEALKEPRVSVSQVMNLLRPNPRIQKKIERKLGVNFDELKKAAESPAEERRDAA